MVGCRITGSGSGLLLYRVCASEGYFDVCLFEKLVIFLTLWLWYVKVAHFFGFVVGIVCEFFCCV